MNGDERRAEIARLEGELAAEERASGQASDPREEPSEQAAVRSGVNRKYVLIAAGLGLLFLVWAFLDGSGLLDDDPPPASSPVVEGPGPSREEDVYLSAIRQQIAVSEVSDAALVTAGREACAALDRGVSPAEVLVLAEDSLPTNGPIIVGTAVGSLCREHIPAVEDFLDTLG